MRPWRRGCGPLRRERPAVAFGLTGAADSPNWASRGWLGDRGGNVEESPDSMKQGCRVTPGGGNPRESATEKRLPWCRVRPGTAMVMVKRWGKSPPRTGQPGRYGKPHPEQCRIGALRGKVVPDGKETATGTLQPKGPGWQLDRPGNRCGRGMVIQGGNPGTESGLQAIRASYGISRTGVSHPRAALPWAKRLPPWNIWTKMKGGTRIAGFLGEWGRSAADLLGFGIWVRFCAR